MTVSVEFYVSFLPAIFWVRCRKTLAKRFNKCCPMHANGEPCDIFKPV